MQAYNTSIDAPLFAARLTPYRSLGALGFKILMLAVGTFCFIAGLVFFLLGLWPVVGFLGLDLLLVYWAFKANYRSAKAYEDVAVSREEVLVRKVSPSGKIADHTLPQFGTRFETDRHAEIGITRMGIRNRNTHVTFGSFLNPADRESFADAFSRALAQAKK